MKAHHWESIIGRHLDGVATPEEVAALSAQLESDAETRMLYLQIAHIHATLAAEDIEEPLGCPALSEPNVAGTQRRRMRKRWPLATVVLAGLVLIALVLVLPIGSDPPIGALPSLGATLQWASEAVRKNNNIWGAARDGKTNAVDRLLEQGVAVDARIPCRELTPLHVAAIYGRLQVAKQLLDRGADVSLADVEGNTALHMAAFLAHQEVVELLLGRGASVHDRNALGQTPVDFVAAEWSPGLESLYTEIGKKMDRELDLDRIKRTRPTILTLLRQRAKKTQDTKASVTPPDIDLWRAAADGNVAAIKQHVAAGTYLNGKEPFGGSTPLMLACIFGKTQTARVLIDSGADLKMTNHHGGTALHSAAFFCQPEIAKILLESGVNAKTRNKDGATALDVVECDWSSKLEDIYRHVYGMLNIELDVEQIKKTRREVAQVLRGWNDTEE